MDKKTLSKKSVMIIGRSEVGAEASVHQEFASGIGEPIFTVQMVRAQILSPLKEVVN